MGYKRRRIGVQGTLYSILTTPASGACTKRPASLSSSVKEKLAKWLAPSSSPRGRMPKSCRPFPGVQ